MEIDWKLPLIVDASALIDYCESDLSILSRFAQEVLPVYIGKAAFDKVEQLSEALAHQHNITIFLPELELALQAAQARGSLAYDDHETLLIAKSKSWCCLTNDKALRRECLRESVQVRWGLEPMKMLVARKLITVPHAIRVALKMSNVNPFITQKIVSDFEEQIRMIRRT